MKTLVSLCFGISLFGVNLALASEVLVLGNESMPFNGIVNGKNAGITIEILQEATKHGAPTFRYRLGLPWKRAQNMVLEAGNNATALIPLTRTSKRESQYVWIADMFTHQPRLSTTVLTSLPLEKAKNLDIGVIRGSAMIPLFEQIGLIKLMQVDSALQNAKKLANGRLDAVAESQYVDT